MILVILRIYNQMNRRRLNYNNPIRCCNSQRCPHQIQPTPVMVVAILVPLRVAATAIGYPHIYHRRRKVQDQNILICHDNGTLRTTVDLNRILNQVS